MSHTPAITILLRYLPVSVLRSRLTFLLLCLFSLFMFGILQSGLKTNSEKLGKTVFTGDVSKVERQTLTKDATIRLPTLKEISRDNLKRLKSLVLVDDRKQFTRSKHSERSLLPVVKRSKPQDYEDIQDEQSTDEGYHAHGQKNEELQDELYRLLLKLTNEGNVNDLIKDTKLNDMDEKERFPYNPLIYPQRINIEKLLKTLAKNGDLPGNPINEWKYTAIRNPSGKCEHGGKDVFLLLIVKTKPENFVKRKTIRKTWADEKRFPNIRTVFSIGIPRDDHTINKIKLESLKYKDVLLMDYMDTYHNLTLKTTSGINWAVANCNMAEFVVSVDDDMYVATDFLLKHLKEIPRAEAERLYHGHMYHDTSPIRHGGKDNGHSKWTVTMEEYPFDTYPDYIFGGFIIMSMRTVLEMSLVIPYTKPVNMEDVYLGIVASRLGIVATNTDLVNCFLTYSNVEKFKTLIASHYYTSAHMLEKAWECHLSIVEEDIEKSVFCDYMKTKLKQLKTKVEELLNWIDLSDDAL